MTALSMTPTTLERIDLRDLEANRFSLSIYGNPDAEIGGLLESVRDHGVLVPLVIVSSGTGWEVISGHRRLACARNLGFTDLPCEIRVIEGEEDRKRAVLEYNRQRRKTFSQLMREADALEDLLGTEARERSRANLRKGTAEIADRRNSDSRTGRTDSAVAAAIGLGGKDLYRQARSIWKVARGGDPRALSSVEQLDAGTKTIHAAYKDLRRRNRFTTDFRPTPYDVWAFKHDRAFGIPHPGSIPPGIIAHTLHYFTQSGALVVDPMAGGGTTLDVCESMGRRCLAYDVTPVRPDVRSHDIRLGFPPEARECDFIFCDPPYHTMLARQYSEDGVANEPFSHWLAFLRGLAVDAFATLRPGGRLALLLANQTEKDLPAGHGYIDHAFHGYNALIGAGFLPERRISCPMDGAYLPQHVRQARLDGRMLGQVRDLIVVRKPLPANGYEIGSPPASS
ncbi:DNA methyltransferase [Tundrisphaera lichenicola]|uniref:DNA methyltransferase n=1 Tax=Tundrisphaera lichenicola TaxID=2029860 RepID=UPI003EB92108